MMKHKLLTWLNSKFTTRKKAQYDDAKDAFNKMVAERGGNPEKYKQDLTFLSEELADGETTKITHQTTGLTTYLTKEGRSRMYGDGKATKMYETKESSRFWCDNYKPIC